MRRLATAKKQVVILKMLTQITGFVHSAADKATRDWADLNQRIDDMHIRCVRKLTQRAYNIGIEAATRRNERQKLEDKTNLSREDAQVSHLCLLVYALCLHFCLCLCLRRNT